MSKATKAARKRLQTIYGRMYTRAPNIDLSLCAYCGSPRQCMDHVPPIKWVEAFDPKTRPDLLLYPSCADCNKYLSDRPLFSYGERLVFLYEKYMKLIDRETGLWSEDEIEEMGYSLQILIRARKVYLAALISKHRGVEENVLKHL